MNQQANLYGPPGSGKTRRLGSIAQAVVAEHGPQALGAVTFTRAAAGELVQRLGGGKFPYVGTIHSLCYRALGQPPILRPSDRLAWARGVGDQLASFGGADSPNALDTYELPDLQNLSPAVRSLQLYAAARQRRQPIDQVFWLLEDGGGPSLEAVSGLVRSYEDFKRQAGRIDFEDLLEYGRNEPIPVRYLLVDEAQDNSALLWSVIDAWAERIPYLICAGDPYQAIFQFSGGDPRLFRGRAGSWQLIGDSFRLDQASADFARAILRDLGPDPLLAAWAGRGSSAPEDASHFWLARTNRLVDQLATELRWQGIPYANLNGSGPLGGRAATAYRALLQLRDEGSISGSQTEVVAQAMPARLVGHAEKQRVQGLGKASPDARFSADDLRWDAERALRSLPDADYFGRVVANHGPLALAARPLHLVGTIHAAKGREADHVHVSTSWGSLPAERAATGDPAEALIAYVACTRHRRSLEFKDVLRPTEQYPFPARMVVKGS